MKKIATLLVAMFAIVLLPNQAQALKGATLTLQKSASMPDQNIASSLYGQMLGAYDITVCNGPVFVQSSTFFIATSTGGKGNVSEVIWTDTGNVIQAGPVEPEFYFEGVPLSEINGATFENTVRLENGVNTVYIKGHVLSGFPLGGRLITGTSLNSWTVTDAKGKALTGLSTDIIVGQVVTVKGPTATVGFVGKSQSLTAGMKDIHGGTYTVKATQSSEDLRVSALPGKYTATKDGKGLTRFRVYSQDGTLLTTGANISYPSASGLVSLQLDGNGFIVPKGTETTFEVLFDVEPSAHGTFTFGLPGTTPVIRISGVESGRTAIIELGDSMPASFTVAEHGTFRVQNASDTPEARSVALNREVVLNIFEFPITGESGYQRSFGLRFTGSNANALKDRKYTVWADRVQIGESYFIPGETESVVQLLTRPYLPVEGPVGRLTVKAVLVSKDTGLVKNGDTVGIAYNADRPNDTIAFGAESGANFSPTPDSVAEGNLINLYVPPPKHVGTKLTIEVDPSTPTVVTTGEAIPVAKFRVKGTDGNGAPLTAVGWEFTIIANGLQGASPFVRASILNSEGREVVSSDDSFFTLTEWPEGQNRYPAGSGSILLAGDSLEPTYTGYPLGDDVYTLTIRVPWDFAGKEITIVSESISAVTNERRSFTNIEHPSTTVRVAQVPTVIVPTPVVVPPTPPQPDIRLDVSFASTTSTEVEVGQNIVAKVHVTGRSTQDKRVPQLLAWGFTVVADGLTVADIIPFSLLGEDGNMVATTDQPPSQTWGWGANQSLYPEKTPHVILVTGDVFNPDFVGHSLANDTFIVSFVVPASLAGKYLTIVSDEIVATLDNHGSLPSTRQTEGASITLYVRPPASSGGGSGNETITTPTPTSNDNGVVIEIIPDVEVIPVENLVEPVAPVVDLTREVVDTVIVSFHPQDQRWFILVQLRRPLQAGEYVEWVTADDGFVTQTIFEQGKPGLAFATGNNYSYLGFFAPTDSYPEGVGANWLQRFGLVSILRDN